MGSASLQPIDLVILMLYGAVILILGPWLARQVGRRGGTDGVSRYFLAGRAMTWPVIGLSLFASNISSTTMIGLAGDAYASGIWVFNYEWMAVLVLVFVAVFVLPQVLRSGVFTMPELLEQRFGRAARLYFAGLTLFLTIVVDTSASLFAGALVVQVVFPQIESWQIIAFLALLSGTYTIIGGLSAVMITDVIQAVLLLLGAAVIAAIAWGRIGGWSTITAAVPPEKLSLIRPADDPGMPWPALITGVSLLGFYFWGTNQFMAQRFLAAKDVSHARWGAMLAGVLKLTVLFVMVLPGTMALILYEGQAIAPNDVYPSLMFDLLPPGLLGLVLAGFFAALMSQIDSTLNSASTLVTMDFVRTARPDLSSKRLSSIGKGTTFLFMLLAVAWAPQIGRFESLFQYLQQVLSYTVGPVVALYLIGLFCPSATRKGANWGLLVGMLLGLLLFITQGVAPGLVAQADRLSARGERVPVWLDEHAALAERVLGEGGSLIDAAWWHWLYVSPVVAGATAIVIVVVSLVTTPPGLETTRLLTWTRESWRAETASLHALPWYTNYRIQTIALVFAVSAIVWTFR